MDKADNISDSESDRPSFFLNSDELTANTPSSISMPPNTPQLFPSSPDQLSTPMPLIPSSFDQPTTPMALIPVSPDHPTTPMPIIPSSPHQPSAPMSLIPFSPDESTTPIALIPTSPHQLTSPMQPLLESQAPKSVQSTSSIVQSPKPSEQSRASTISNDNDITILENSSSESEDEWKPRSSRQKSSRKRSSRKRSQSRASSSSKVSRYTPKVKSSYGGPIRVSQWFQYVSK